MITVIMTHIPGEEGEIFLAFDTDTGHYEIPLTVCYHSQLFVNLPVGRLVVTLWANRLRAYLGNNSFEVSNTTGVFHYDEKTNAFQLSDDKECNRWRERMEKHEFSHKHFSGVSFLRKGLSRDRS